ncbi:MAG: radical SAM protein [Deltaproteobacteria bacterium]|nr:radical SAM protein [Deltaproteobacteria bacterium]
MDFLVLSPPVCPPSEPPSGAFILASALCGHGYDTGFLDLSLEFYHRILTQHSTTPGVLRSVDYLSGTPQYDPMTHRSAAGTLHRAFKGYSKSHPGWTLTAMDLTPPAPVHQPSGLLRLLLTDDPFLPLWNATLPSVLSRYRPRRILISVAYLSQLTAAISLARFLERHGIEYIAGGSLLRSLHATGKGFNLLERTFHNIDVSNGANLLPGIEAGHFLDKLAYPQILSQQSYLSGRPILPLTLSIGCYWSGCLFCPDKDMKYIQMKTTGLEQFMASIPQHVLQQRPVIHFLDSAMPKNRLRAVMPIAKHFGLHFYGFARPEKRFADHSFLRELARSGCVMLQLGVEGGNDALLSRFNKGIHPDDAKNVLTGAAEAGIRTYVYLLFGLPGETVSEREDTRRLISETIDAVDFLNLSIFNLPRHCDLIHRAKEFNIILNKYDALADAIELYRPFKTTNSSESPRRAAREFITNRFTSDDRIRQAVLRTPKWFRAAHLALMNISGRN